VRLACWFCGDEVTTGQHDRVVGMHRDVESSAPRIVIIHTTWRTTSVRVPRCARCRRGHRIEQSLMVLAAASVIGYSASGQLDRLLGINPVTPAGKVYPAIWAVVACLPLLAWIATRQAWLPWNFVAPHRLRYAHLHPRVRQLRAGGWQYRSGPFPAGLKDWDLIQPATTSSRLRRIAATVLVLLGFAGLVAALVMHLRHSGLAYVPLLAGIALLFLASRIEPER
jgi:hypothetical protein